MAGHRPVARGDGVSPGTTPDQPLQKMGRFGDFLDAYQLNPSEHYSMTRVASPIALATSV